MKTLNGHQVMVQSISDIITNSSSEVFLCYWDPSNSLEGYDWSVDPIDEKFMCSNPDKDIIYEYMEIPDILEEVWIDYDHPDKLVECDNDDYKNSGVKYSDLLEMFREYVKENQEKFDEVLGSYLVSVSDHDHENYEHNCSACDDGHLLGHW